MYNFNSKMNGMAIVATVMQNIIKNNLFLLNAIIELTGTLLLFISISSLRRECVNIFSMSKKCKFEVSIFFYVQYRKRIHWAEQKISSDGFVYFTCKSWLRMKSSRLFREKFQLFTHFIIFDLSYTVNV